MLAFQNGQMIRGDVLIRAVLRYDLSPVPATLEADIRTGDEETEKLLAEGRVLEAANGDRFSIVKSVRVINRAVQGGREMNARRVTALLESCKNIAFVRGRAVIKENAALSAIYRAAGAPLPAIASDFAVPRFYCLVGETPSFHIARVLQEEGGVFCWRRQKPEFIRLPNLFRQKPVEALPNNAADNVESGFLERHEVPWYFSLAQDSSFVMGNRAKPRAVVFSPWKGQSRLFNMTQSLIHRKTVKIGYNANLQAGSLVEFVDGEPLAIVTAAHVYGTGTDDGGGEASYTQLWLASLEA